MVSSRQILGIQFFNGDVEEAVGLMLQRGGLLVAPSGTCFARLRADKIYRRAVLAADLAIADSGLMVVLWRLLRRENVQRFLAKIFETSARQIERRGEARRVLGPSDETRRAKINSIGRAAKVFRQQGELLCRAAVRFRSRRSRSSCAD